ncbi:MULTISPECIES: hypothetical protein [unclassified Streptomyces]|uniref:hypothetical protein n=1 Tax=unclassified Streptomyces TaxID=2593676 RepID=UPI00278BD87F|nr:MULTISPECIES: hypothetical protein [unclassified Streptomyces]
MTATLTPTRPHPSRPAPPRHPARRIPWLALAALLYAAVQLLAVVPAHLGLGWDETVYVSQVDPRTPAAFFSAPRSRGISYLVAPLLAVTASPTALRVTLALASAAALYAAFRVWRPLLGRAPVALAALGFGTLWVTVLYGSQAMPNLWVALAAVAAVGWFLRAAGPSAPRRAYAMLAACTAAATLFRLSDGFWLALPLLTGTLLVRAWRRPAPLLALLAGLTLGGAPWIAEAYRRFGGIGPRLHASSATEGGMRPHWNVPAAWHDLNGPLLCRPCTAQLTHPAHTLWWLALPALTAAACGLAVRTRRPGTTLLPIACALALGAPYLLLIDYFAPRFLLPAYALLSLPLAALAVHVVRAFRPRTARAFALAALLALGAAHLATQYAGLHTNLADARTSTAHYAKASTSLHRLGLRAPCLIAGEHAPPIAYATGCASANVTGNNLDTTPTALRHAAAHHPTATLTRAHHTPFYAHGWTPHPLPGTGLTAYTPPPDLWHGEQPPELTVDSRPASPLDP